jgi:hypothetical protein
MTTSINQPWAISDKMRNRYGNTWADLDFTFEPKISAEIFGEDPMNVIMGSIHIVTTSIPMRYKDLISYTKSVGTLSTNLYSERIGKTETFEVSIKGRVFMLNRMEIGKLYETLNDSTNTALKAYALGLYL